jgi:SAM-dependent methyltransferase
VILSGLPVLSTRGQRLFAWALARFNPRYEHLFAERKRALFATLAGTVVEIGPSTGANLPYLPRGLRWIGIEPNPAMDRYLLRRSRALEIDGEIRRGCAEAIPLPDQSADAILSTHVLCSVAALDPSLAEILRVLKPGGRLLFLEHVAAPAGTRLRTWQRLCRPLWTRLCGGCQPDRETSLALETAGFASVEIARFQAPLPLIAPHIAGWARKRSAPDADVPPSDPNHTS